MDDMKEKILLVSGVIVLQMGACLIHFGLGLITLGIVLITGAYLEYDKRNNR